MAKGGKTNEQMLKLGRGLAKVANQKSGKKVNNNEVKAVKNG